MADDDLDLGPASRQIRDEVLALPERLRTVIGDTGTYDEFTMGVVTKMMIPLFVTLAGHIDALRLQLGGDVSDDVRVAKDTTPDLRIVLSGDELTEQ